MRLHGGDLFVDAALKQAAGVPAGNQLQVVAAQDRPQYACLSGKFIAQFKAGKSRLPPFAQAGLQRRVRAEGRQIVIRLGQRIDAQLYGHDVLLNYACPRSRHQAMRCR